MLLKVLDFKIDKREKPEIRRAEVKNLKSGLRVRHEWFYVMRKIIIYDKIKMVSMKMKTEYKTMNDYVYVVVFLIAPTEVFELWE